MRPPPPPAGGVWGAAPRGASPPPSGRATPGRRAPPGRPPCRPPGPAPPAPPGCAASCAAAAGAGPAAVPPSPAIDMPEVNLPGHLTSETVFGDGKQKSSKSIRVERFAFAGGGDPIPYTMGHTESSHSRKHDVCIDSFSLFHNMTLDDAARFTMQCDVRFEKRTGQAFLLYVSKAKGKGQKDAPTNDSQGSPGGVNTCSSATQPAGRWGGRPGLQVVIVLSFAVVVPIRLPLPLIPGPRQALPHGWHTNSRTLEALPSLQSLCFRGLRNHQCFPIPSSCPI